MTPKPPPPPDPSGPAEGEIVASGDAEQLIDAAEEMLRAISRTGRRLDNPINLLALQLLGPIIARALGDDPRRSSENLIQIAENLDVAEVTALIENRRNPK